MYFNGLKLYPWKNSSHKVDLKGNLKGRRASIDVCLLFCPPVIWTLVILGEFLILRKLLEGRVPSLEWKYFFFLSRIDGEHKKEQEGWPWENYLYNSQRIQNSLFLYTKEKNHKSTEFLPLQRLICLLNHKLWNWSLTGSGWFVCPTWRTLERKPSV